VLAVPTANLPWNRERCRSQAEAVTASPRSPSLLRVLRRFPCLRYPTLAISPQGTLCVDQDTTDGSDLSRGEGDARSRYNIGTRMTILNASISSHKRAAERLQREIPIWLTTVGRTGQPQSSPVWFWWDGEVFHLISQPGATKITNLRENPLVSLHLQADEIAEDDIAIFEGVAEFDPVGTDAAWLPAYLGKVS
jgi:PPOX class probable F420-dependent enzyme